MKMQEDYDIKEEEKEKLVLKQFRKVKNHASEEEYLNHVLNGRDIFGLLTK